MGKICTDWGQFGKKTPWVDTAAALRAADGAAFLNQQVEDVESNFTVQLPSGRVRAVKCYYTADGKRMQSAHAGGVGHRCWLCEHKTDELSNLVPEAVI